MSWVIYHAVEPHGASAKQQALRLAEAVIGEDLAAIKKLLNSGVDPNVKIVGQNCEPLFFLSFAKSWFSLPRAKIDDVARRSYRVTAKLAALRLLLEHGANPNLRDSQGRTPLDIAILWCLPEVVKLLLLYGADPNSTNARGQTPLIEAAILGIQDARPMQQKLQIIIDLLDSGAEIDAQAPDGKTALMYAVGHSRSEIVKLLVNSGASLTICDRQGNQAKDIVSRGSTIQQQQYLRQILNQPQINIRKHKYRQYLPEGDRQLAPIVRRKVKMQDANQIPRRFK